MIPGQMHEGEQATDANLVRRLIAAQFPQWTGEPVRPLLSWGTDHALYRVGDGLLARLPRIGWAVGEVEQDLTWLPRLAPALPLEIAQPLALGQPGEGYPWPWGIYRWLPGEMATLSGVQDDTGLAAQLAAFVLALRRADVTGAPRAESPGRLLVDLGPHVERALADSAELLPPEMRRRATELWAQAVTLPGWSAAPAAVHGDLHANNLLLRAGRLAAVLDFGLRLDDPAVDLLPAWNTFRPAARATYLRALAPDAGTRARGRALALAKALLALPYYRYTNPEIVERALFTLEQVTAPPELGHPADAPPAPRPLP
jgi:aminoglycoside phosphotransferase (APT) family kinase protein